MTNFSDLKEQSSSSSLKDDKMMEQNEMIQTVEARLNQIREYIQTTAVMMDSLKKSSDPRAKAQHEKLGRMVEDLYDSEIKLVLLLKKYRCPGNENGEEKPEEKVEDPAEEERRQKLYKKMEESQRKLTQLQDHQTQLLEMQKAMSDSLTKARQLQSSLKDLDEQESPEEPSPEDARSKMIALTEKLSQLQAKKNSMDQFMATINAIESEWNSNNAEERSIREKEIELDSLKCQLAQLKILMENAVKGSNDKISEIEEKEEKVEEEKLEEEKIKEALPEVDDEEKIEISKKLQIEEIQAVTKELKEQRALLQATRIELFALKQSAGLCTKRSVSESPQPSVSNNSCSENVQNGVKNANENLDLKEMKHQIDDFIKKA